MRTLLATALLLLLNFIDGSAGELLIEIDDARNLPSTNTTSFAGIANEINNFYFKVSGDEARYSSYQFVDNSENAASYSFNVLPIITQSSVLLRLTISSLVQETIDDQTVLNLKTNFSESVHFSFTIHEISDVTLVGCLNDVVSIKIPSNRNLTHLSVFGRESVPECNFQILLVDNEHEVELPMSQCGIAYEQEFLLRFTKLTDFEGIENDMNARLTCKRQTNIYLLTNSDVTSRYETADEDDQLSFSQDVQIVMYLHERGNSSHVYTNQGVTVRTPVSLKIEMDSLYTSDFDAIPLMCTANNIPILGTYDSLTSFPNGDLENVGCAVSHFSNFAKLGNGEYRSDFDMFRTVTSGVSDSAVNFQCLMFVCRTGTCPVLPCIL